MKYIGQYIRQICPEVEVVKSKTTESVYYRMGNGFIVRLSEHIGSFCKSGISIVKSFNTNDFIVTVENNPFPLIKCRNEVKEMIKVLYEYHKLSYITKGFYEDKHRLELEMELEWEKFWDMVCKDCYNARYFTQPQKLLIRKYFDGGLRGLKMVECIKRIKPRTSIESIEDIFEGKDKIEEEDDKGCIV